MNSQKHTPTVVRNFITRHRHGVLSTLSHSNAGFPFGSIVPYDLTPDGDFVIYVSLIAEHYKNLVAEPRASVTLVEDLSAEDPQAGARATVLLSFTPIAKDSDAEVRERYEARFPNAVNHEIAHNFLFLRGRPTRIRWIGGFGDIAWISGESYRDASPDAISYIAESAIHHMHADHYGALVRLVMRRGIPNLEAKRIAITEITPNTFTVAISGDGTNESLEFSFARPVNTSEELRLEMIALIR